MSEVGAFPVNIIKVKIGKGFQLFSWENQNNTSPYLSIEWPFGISCAKTATGLRLLLKSPEVNLFITDYPNW